MYIFLSFFLLEYSFAYFNLCDCWEEGCTLTLSLKVLIREKITYDRIIDLTQLRR